MTFVSLNYSHSNKLHQVLGILMPGVTSRADSSLGTGLTSISPCTMIVMPMCICLSQLLQFEWWALPASLVREIYRQHFDLTQSCPEIQAWPGRVAALPFCAYGLCSHSCVQKDWTEGLCDRLTPTVSVSSMPALGAVANGVTDTGVGLTSCSVGGELGRCSGTSDTMSRRSHVAKTLSGCSFDFNWCFPAFTLIYQFVLVCTFGSCVLISAGLPVPDCQYGCITVQKQLSSPSVSLCHLVAPQAATHILYDAKCYIFGV